MNCFVCFLFLYIKRHEETICHILQIPFFFFFFFCFLLFFFFFFFFFLFFFFSFFTATKSEVLPGKTFA